eukprot:TRINITY_DN931_c0_g1_i1.p1 TRINITY_DN931_c0_g1~~TRINITY_DN931_c0_g1_i1.p1  ORF type:complete len:1690 (-),score=186.44 TRINITY_DN931_c0_g1_i1:61-5130(-)
MFNPQAHKEYIKKVPLYVDDVLDRPYLEFEMRGRGTTPKLVYDKKEIIIPPAPLKLESRAIFRVQNRGYENLDLSKYRVKFMDYPPDPIPVELQFPEKTKAVNISKKDLKIESVFKSVKPINMTAKIEFQDDLINQPDTIDVSAVSDNCILTTYSYILRWRDEVSFMANNGTIELKHECPDSDDESSANIRMKQSGRALSKAGSTYSRTSRKAVNMIGYTPLRPEVQRKTCDYIRRWLNSNALTSVVQHFPQDLIKEHGKQVYELLHFLTGKSFAPPANIAQPPAGANSQNGSTTGREEDIEKVTKAKYEWLLTELTKYGAMLNTIRPEHLLSEEEYKLVCEKNKYGGSDISSRFAYLSEEAWITLFYQILKIFYLRRVNMGTFKTSSMIPSPEKTLPRPNTSNVYSDSELLLLKWLEYHYNQQNPYHHKTLTNFESDLQDSLVFAAVIKSYCRNVKGLMNMRTVTKSLEDNKFNAQKVIYTLKTELQLRTHITEEDILDPSAREMVIFCTQLFLYLPHYIPSDSIVFSCTLSQTVTKTIELRNDNKDRISYFVQLEGSPDFVIGDKRYITIEPGKTEAYPVTFVSRISKPVEAILMFNNHGDGPKQAAPLVFRLESNVTKRISAQVYSQNTDTNLYEPKEIPIEIPNKFSKNARFSIELKYERRKPVKAEQKNQKGNKKGNKAPDVTEEILKYIPDPFFCKHETIAVNKGQTTTLPVIFLPFELGVHECFIVLVDNDVGELQFQIIANAKLPSPQSEPITKTFPTESRQIIDLPIPSRNIKMESARALLHSQCTKERKEREKINWENYKRLMQEQQAFEVKITDTSSVFKAPNTITVIDRSALRRDQLNMKPDVSRMISDMASEKGEDNRLQIEFMAKVVKRYETKVMIANPYKTDVRIYDLMVKTHPPPVYGQLTFNVPARHQVIQDIPINNESERDWNIKVDLQYDRGQPARFEITRGEYMAPKKQVTNIQLKFAPDWVCDCKGKLTITIQSTLQTFVYELLGKGEEPLAEEKIVVNCEAKKNTRYTLNVRNDTEKVMHYRVETDMSKVLSGEATLKLLPREVGKYVLNITPLVGGVDMGSITFIDNEERYIWYVVELHVRSPEAEEEKPMQTYVRKPIAYEFSIKNPLNEPVTFDVDIKGEGLIGEPSLGIPANQTKVYELVYAPLRSGEYQGYINFVSEKAGEIKYKLALKAEDNPPIPLEFMEVELGKTGIHHVTLENPTKEEQLILVHNSNPTNYDLQEKFIIPPYSAMDVPIKYIPSNLDATESARIVFDSKNIGRWEFTLEGRGKLPTETKTERVTTTVGDTIPSSIVFKNPLKEQATIEITLEPSDSKEFMLLTTKPKVVLPPLSSYAIRFQFAPRSMTLAKAVLMVSMSKTLVWRYLLEGDAEYLAHGQPFALKCQARKRSQETLKIQLPELAELRSDDVFSIEVVPKEPSLAGLIDRSVVIDLARQNLNKMDEPLECFVKFEPLRPFKAQTELLVSKSSGGRWRFAAIFEATEPEVDDIIEIKSPLHKTSSVSFRLCNHTRTYADFQAFFTHDSATEFSVYPKSGVLEPFGKDGTNFIVSFTPTEYGKNKTGKLIIQTEEMQWTYKIKGSHPEYKVPKPGGGRLDNKLNKDLESKLLHRSPVGTKKNFIVENIKKQKELEKKLTGGKSRESSPGKSRAEFSMSKYSFKKQQLYFTSF